jgi:hypothetical protein
MKCRLAVSLFIAALALLPALARAEDMRWDSLYVYTLADGEGVAVAVPAEWQETSKTRVLEAGAPARFIDGAGRRVEIPAATLQRAADTKSIAWPRERRRVALRTN